MEFSNEKGGEREFEAEVAERGEKRKRMRRKRGRRGKGR